MADNKSQGQSQDPQRDPTAPQEDTGVHSAPDKKAVEKLLANEAVDVPVVSREEDVYGKHGAKPGELMPDHEYTAKSDRQRYEAQKDEPLEYPGDSGVQAKARLSARNK